MPDPADPASALTLTVPAERAGRRLDQVLAAEIAALSRSRAQRLIADGAVTVDGAPAPSAKHKLAGGEVVALPADAAEAGEGPAGPPAAEAIPLTIVYEDAHLLVIDKPAGMVVHPGAGGEAGTLAAALLHHVGPELHAAAPEDAPERPGIVHRLDKDTSGLMVAAKTAAVRDALSDALQRRALTRAYTALVWGVPDPPTGTIDAPLGRDPERRQRRAVRADGRAAVTHYALAQRLAGGRASQLTCHLESGRTHQVRVHLAHKGHPVIADPLYGRRRAPSGLGRALKGLDRQGLHAHHLAFPHPVTGALLAFDSPLPADLARVRDALDAL